MEDYIGVKFKPQLTSKQIRHGKTKEIVTAGTRLDTENLVFGSSGNISVRTKDGFLITASGTTLDKLSADDFVLVTDCDLKNRIVAAEGKANPSSEAILHFLIYKTNPSANAIVHTHAGAFLNEAKVATSGFLCTNNFLNYGTLELAYDVVKTMGKNDFLVIKEHGAISVGDSVKEATDLMIAKFHELKGMQVRVGSVKLPVVIEEQEERAGGSGQEAVEDSKLQIPNSKFQTEEPEVTKTDELISNTLEEESIETNEPTDGEPDDPEMPADFFEKPDEEPKTEEEPKDNVQTSKSKTGQVLKQEKSTKLQDEVVNPWGGEVLETEEPGYMDEPESSDKPKSSFKFPKFKLPQFKTPLFCPDCGVKKKTLSRSCANCGHFFGFDKISKDTTNLIKVERKKKN
ncbi:MAG: class II aldolase/adducin family protein [Candidatus Undinarchaeales archaeon]|nr:class II aldolase/adducin family protein [Candidatus Undinarchaeales archaeon]